MSGRRKAGMDVVIVTGGTGCGKSGYIRLEYPRCTHVNLTFYDGEESDRILGRALACCRVGAALVVECRCASLYECGAIMRCVGVKKAKVIEVSSGDGVIQAAASDVYLKEGK